MPAAAASKSQISAAEFVKVSASDWESKYRFLHVFVSSAGSQFFYGFANEPGASPSTDPEGIPGAGATDQLVPNSAMSYHYSRLPEIRPGAGLKYNEHEGFGVSARHLLFDPLDSELDRLPAAFRKFRAQRSLRDVEPSTGIWVRRADGTAAPEDEE